MIEAWKSGFNVRWLAPWLTVISILAGLSACGTQSGNVRAPKRIPASGVHHTVQPGENLFRIGLIYNITVDTLVRANNLRDPGQLEVGQRIYIPGASAHSARRHAPRDNTPGMPSRSPDSGERLADNLLWPISGTISSTFGPRGGSFHDGIDIAAAEGTPIHAVADGEVLYSDQLRGYGNIVILRHQDGLVSVYAHNETNLVEKGARVNRGQVIARVGSTGQVTGPHLHFEIRQNNAPRDPIPYLPQLCCVEASDMVTPKG